MPKDVAKVFSEGGVLVPGQRLQGWAVGLLWRGNVQQLQVQYGTQSQLKCHVEMTEAC